MPTTEMVERDRSTDDASHDLRSRIVPASGGRFRWICADGRTADIPMIEGME